MPTNYPEFEDAGYEIKQRFTETQQGDDIIAVRDGETLLVEAKGDTSARKGSRRYGKPFK